MKMSTWLVCLTSALCLTVGTPRALPPECNIDNDGDGYEREIGCGDCNDNDASIYTGATELCDGKDNDCDGPWDETCAAECSGTASSSCSFVSSLLAERVGFGASTTGGLNGSIVYVTSLANSGTGTLRDAVSSGSRWIRFRINGDIVLTSDIDLLSNQTIDARGASIRIMRYGLNINDKHNVIVENLKFHDAVENTNDIQAIEVRTNSYDIWVDHCEFSDYTDGLLDIGRGSHNATVSWSEFSDHDKVMLLGWSNDASTNDQNLTVTVHHNYFHNLDYRLPWVKFGKAHVFNNVYENWSSAEHDAVRSTQGAQVYVEKNSFNGNEDEEATDCTAGGEANGYLKTVSNELLNGAWSLECNPGSVFTPSTYYTYTADTANSTMVTNVKANSGRR